jgi:single-strand DNA-binding protein
MNMNRVQLIGNLGRDADSKSLSNGYRTMLSVATNHRWKDVESGEWKQRTEWHTVVAWGKVAEQAASLKKGASVFIQGELRGREYEQEDTKHRVSEIVADMIAPLAA